MKRTCKRLAMLLALCAVIALAAFLLQPDRPRLKLADGSTVSVLKTSYGEASHRLVRGGLGDKVLYGWVPTTWLDMCRFGGPASTSWRYAIARRAMKHISAAYTTTNTLVVWFRQSSTNTTLSNLRVLPVDQNGDVWAAPLTLPDSLSQNQAQSVGSAERYFYFSYPAFPRRERVVRLRVFEQHGKEWAAVGNFEVPNPVARDYPHWNMPSMPAKASLVGYDFTLTNLVTGADFIYRPPRRAATGEIGSIMGEFQFTREGRRSDAWSVQGLAAEDATGNRWESAGYSRFGDNAIAIGGRLPTNEPLKVRAKFMRRADFETNELWTVPDVALPSPGQFTLLSNVFVMDGTTITLRGVSAANVKFPGANGWGSNPSVHFTAAQQTRGTLWRLSVVEVLDEQGRQIRASQHPFPMQVTPGIPLSFPLLYPTNLTRATVVFALHKPRTIEFMARAAVP